MIYHTIKINEQEKKLIVYFMKKQLEIHNRLLITTGEKKYEEEIKIRESILKALGKNIDISKANNCQQQIENELKSLGLQGGK